MTKVCPRCALLKDMATFPKDAQKSDGLSTYCRTCKRTINRATYKKATAGRKRNTGMGGLSVKNPAGYYKMWASKNPKKVRLARNKWEASNQHRRRESGMRRYCAQTNQTPAWLSPAHKAEIEGMYLFCSIFKGYQVDHIVPIRGKMVAGLHVPWNLQVLPALENQRKSNYFNTDTYAELLRN